MPCGRAEEKSRCKKCNFVYLATCIKCKYNGSFHPSTYIGVTSHTLAERCSEHATQLENLDHKLFMVTHRDKVHADMEVAPASILKQ